MDERLGMMINAFAVGIGQNLKQSFFQSLGVDSKLQKGFEKRLAGDIINNQAGWLNLVPQVKEYIEDNPAAVKYALPYIRAFTQKMNLAGNDGSQGSDPFR